MKVGGVANGDTHFLEAKKRLHQGRKAGALHQGQEKLKKVQRRN